MKTKVIVNTDRDINCKWPQMCVTGEDVTIDQAKDIIRRTDSFFL